LVVVNGFPQRHKCEQIHSNYKSFFQGGKCETFKGVNSIVCWWWMQRNVEWK